MCGMRSLGNGSGAKSLASEKLQANTHTYTVEQQITTTDASMNGHALTLTHTHICAITVVHNSNAN